ncbi:MAG TPA: YceI family protein [Accumulibacter sp.]|nr:YceI family protein [Accumulibacter sp.]HMW17355.1 YceI family protein [Accumulibacter sp.]HMX21957.1 YceI family protein [Accumulibacter sp.]HNC17140.1 YceI family protein [Accumulibacter sp.]HND79377.1 YceI family protein [Accumulibacter sp.]
MKKIAFTSLAALALCNTAAFAEPVTYVIEPTHSYPRFEYNHLGFSTQVQRFNKTSGTIVLDRAARNASVDITIDAKSVDTGYSLFNEHLQGEDFLDTARYPTITYRSTAVKFEGDKPVSIDGNLTIKGVTKPVTLTITGFQQMAHPMLKKDTIGANAVTKIKRSEFNAGKHAPYVSDELTLTLAVEALKQ